MPRGDLEVSHFRGRLDEPSLALARLLVASGEHSEILPTGPLAVDSESSLQTAQAIIAAAETVAPVGPLLVVVNSGEAKPWVDFLNGPEGSSFSGAILNEDARRSLSLYVATPSVLAEHPDYGVVHATQVAVLVELDDDTARQVELLLPAACRVWRTVTRLGGKDYVLGQPARLLLGQREPDEVKLAANPRSRPSALAERLLAV